MYFFPESRSGAECPTHNEKNEKLKPSMQMTYYVHIKYERTNDKKLK